MPKTGDSRRCAVCGGQVVQGSICPRCRAQALNSRRMSRSAWIMVGTAVFLLAALFFWVNRINSQSRPSHSGNEPATDLIPDGTPNPGDAVPLAFGNESCRPWNVSAAEKPPPAGSSFVFVTSRMADPYGLVLAGFAAECGREVQSLILEDLAPGALMAAMDKQSAHGKHTTAIVAVGLAAARRVKQEAPQVPLLFAGISDPVAARLGDPHSAGVSPWVPARPLARHMLAILPKKGPIAILHAPGRGAEMAGRVAHEIEAAGRKAILCELSDENAQNRELVSASSAGAWIVLVDRKVIGEKLFNRIQVAAEKQHIPVGVSEEEYVRRGALVGVGPDTHRIGRQLCRLAGALVRHELPEGGNVFCPEYSFAAINITVAEKLGYVYDFRDTKQVKVYKWH